MDIYRSKRNKLLICLQRSAFKSYVHLRTETSFPITQFSLLGELWQKLPQGNKSTIIRKGNKSAILQGNRPTNFDIQIDIFQIGNGIIRAQLCQARNAAIICEMALPMPGSIISGPDHSSLNGAISIKHLWWGERAQGRMFKQLEWSGFQEPSLFSSGLWHSPKKR